MKFIKTFESYWDDEYDYDEYNADYGHRSRNLYAKGHVPNKDEAKLLRSLMSSTGLSEEELRSHKKYRVILSKAQKQGQKAKRTKKQKAMDNVMRRITRELKLPKEHPDVVSRFREDWKEFKESGIPHSWQY